MHIHAHVREGVDARDPNVISILSRQHFALRWHCFESLPCQSHSSSSFSCFGFLVQQMLLADGVMLVCSYQAERDFQHFAKCVGPTKPYDG